MESKIIEAKEEEKIKVKIRRQWNDWRIGEVEFSKLESIHWDEYSGGVQAPAPQPFIHAYVMCNDIEGEVAHTCEHGQGPHNIKVCIVKKDNNSEVFACVMAKAGKKPPSMRRLLKSLSKKR